MAKQFVLDLNKCTGCQACQMACIIENQIPVTHSWRHISAFNPAHLPDRPVYHFSMACNHCAQAPCMEYCPATAYHRDAESGAVLLNGDFCIGCTYCAWVCPYDATRFNTQSGVMEKCTFCNERLREGKDPACISLCPTEALQIEERPQYQAPIRIPGFSEVGIQPGLRIIPLEKNRKMPLLSGSLLSVEAQNLMAMEDHQKSKIELKKEWMLVVFSLLMAWLAGLSAIIVLKGSWRFSPYILWAGFAGIILSSIHLGNKLQAYRAIFNWKKSWLSREILFLNAFLLTFAWQWLFGINDALSGWFTIILSFLMLISIDMVYHVAQTQKPVIPHSAQVTFTGFFILCMGLDLQIPTLMVGMLKLFLYVYRKLQTNYIFNGIGPLLSVLRILSGFVVPVFLLIFICDGNYCLIIWSAVALGELIDRIEFYLELEIITPAGQIMKDIKAME